MSELDKISSGSLKNPLIHKFEFTDREFDFTRDKSPNKILVLPPCMFDALLQFHKIAGDGAIETDIVMDRGFVKTKSITQFAHLKKDTMRYEDLQTLQTTTTSF